MILISATPSPFARKVRIALLEKGVPFTLQNEVPWHADTLTGLYNPLEQLPVLIPDNGQPVFESTTGWNIAIPCRPCSPTTLTQHWKPNWCM